MYGLDVSIDMSPSFRLDCDSDFWWKKKKNRKEKKRKNFEMILLIYW